MISEGIQIQQPQRRLLDLTEEDLQSCPFAQEVLRTLGIGELEWRSRKSRGEQQKMQVYSWEYLLEMEVLKGKVVYEGL